MTALLCQGQVSETRKTEGFSNIEVASGIELSYKETEGETSIRVEANEDAPANIITEVEGETLRIFADGKTKNVKVYVSAKDIASFKASSKSKIVFENTVHAENIAIALESGAYFKGYFKSNGQTDVETGMGTEFNGRIETVAFKGNFKNHSKINISGNAKNAILKSATEAYCNAKNFLTENTEVASDNSTVIITSRNKIDVKATENASVTYFGSPKTVTIGNKSFKYVRPALVAME